MDLGAGGGHASLGGALRAREALSPTRGSRRRTSYVAVAIGLADTGRYGKQSLHWPPGAPVAFAAAAKLSGRVERGATPDIPAAYWVQWLAGTALIPLVFALAVAAAGEAAAPRATGAVAARPCAAPTSRPASPRAARRRVARRRSAPAGGARRRPALVAAAVVATYPPLVEATGDLLSEPLGALWLTAALLALARRRYALAGVLLAAAVLTRANLLVLIPVVAVMLGRRGAWFAVAALVPVVAWSINVGAPVTTGGGSSLFVGTFLPGGGTLPGAKRALKAETIRFAPELRGRHAKELPGDRVLDAVAARDPGSTATPRCATRRCATSRPTRASSRRGSRRWSPRSCRGCGCGPSRGGTRSSGAAADLARCSCSSRSPA